MIVEKRIDLQIEEMSESGASNTIRDIIYAKSFVNRGRLGEVIHTCILSPVGAAYKCARDSVKLFAEESNSTGVDRILSTNETHEFNGVVIPAGVNGIRGIEGRCSGSNIDYAVAG